MTAAETTAAIRISYQFRVAGMRSDEPVLTFEKYAANSASMDARLAAANAKIDAVATEIRAFLASGPKTEGQITFALRAHDSDLVVRALGRLVGKRRGAETSGEIAIGHRGGSEVFGLRG